MYFWLVWKRWKCEDICQVTHTFCGTIEYMAPEILTRTGHGKVRFHHQSQNTLCAFLSGSRLVVTWGLDVWHVDWSSTIYCWKQKENHWEDPQGSHKPHLFFFSEWFTFQPQFCHSGETEPAALPHSWCQRPHQVTFLPSNFEIQSNLLVVVFSFSLILRKLLKRQISQRLGSGLADADPIKTHPFFKVVLFWTIFKKDIWSIFIHNYTLMIPYW